ncbi:MAG: dihydroneopterin aldolase [Hyphomicrobiales bacterium]|nr:dihydroneopterin aldolase [Hyphomicrobiales bacterium]
MTLFLASVTNEAEADTAIAGGADIIDFKDPAKGALGALEPQTLRPAVAHVAGRRRTSAVTGDLPMDPQTLVRAVEDIASTGVDYVKIGLFDDQRRAACIEALSGLGNKFKLIGVVFADETVDLSLVDQLAVAGFHGAMIDTARKGGGRLLSRRDPVWLSAFVERCRRNGLMAGVAGSLEPPDVPRLLPLQPDILGFRGALCAKGERTAKLDPSAISLLRDLIPSDPRDRRPKDDEEDRVDYRLLVGRGYAVEPTDGASRTDRIFVRDFVVPVRIGAYRSEHQATQRVRFNVEAFVQRGTHAPTDLRDVLSYDVITDAIRRIVAEGHVELAEVLAERVAGAVLGQPRVAKVVVRVEKLDIGPAAVGVEITREKTAEAAILRHPAPAASSESSG